MRLVIAQMTLDQRAAVALFRARGFQPEAMLRHHVTDRSGTPRDLLAMSRELTAASE